MPESLEFGRATEASNDLFHRPSISWQLQHLSPSQKRATKMARATVSFRASPFHWQDPPRLCLEVKRGGDTNTQLLCVAKGPAAKHRQACWQQTQTWLNKWFTPTSLDFHSNAFCDSEKVLCLPRAERTLPAAIGPPRYKETFSCLNNEKLPFFILLSSLYAMY